MLQPLAADELLTTIRKVRQRLAFTGPVEGHLIEQCLATAQQAPTPSNKQSWHFVVVADPSKRAVPRRHLHVTL